MNSNVNITCVYLLINMVNGRYYVGSTKNLRKRKNVYRRKFREGKLNKSMQADFNKYGWDCFSFIILKKTDEIYLITEEKRFIRLLDSTNPLFGYNMCDAGEAYKNTEKPSPEIIKKRIESRAGYRHTDETKFKIGSANSGKENYFKGRKRDNLSIPVNQYDLKNNLINSFSSILDASKNTGINKSNIAQCCNSLRKTAGNYIWRKSNELGRFC